MRSELVRQNPRLKTFDYSTPGAYFITACTCNRRHIFGQIINGKMIEEPAAGAIRETWIDLPNHFGNVMLDEFVVMPNHIHGVLLLTDPLFWKAGKKPGNLPTIVGSFKSFAARRFRKGAAYNEEVWQRSYHDHIVRSEYALMLIREYIRNNPIQWHLDRENPEKTGADPFESWLEEQSNLAITPFNSVYGGPG